MTGFGYLKSNKQRLLSTNNENNKQIYSYCIHITTIG